MEPISPRGGREQTERVATATADSIYKEPIQAPRSNSDSVIPGWSAGPDPESRDSGFDASHRPGMTEYGLLRFARNDDKSRYAFATSQRKAPELCIKSLALEGVGNAGCPLHPRPRVRFVVVRSTRVTTSTPESPGIPARNGFNSLCRALPGDRALLPPSSADIACQNPVGPTCLRELDASVGASGPHDFAVRSNRLSSACC